MLGPTPSVMRVRTLSSEGKSSTRRSQLGVPVPLLRTVPSN